jgi:hypothetical protein
MKKTIIIFFLVFSTVVVFAQNAQQEKTDSVCQLVKRYWAEKNADKLYEMAGDAFRQQLSLENFKAVCADKLFPLGEMKTTFESFANGVNKYKAEFSSATLSFYLSLDAKDKMETFLFKPYEQ